MAFRLFRPEAAAQGVLFFFPHPEKTLIYAGSCALF